MHLIIFAAIVAAGGAAKLDRSYLPPASAATAGGSAENLQLPISRSNEAENNVPAGGFINDHQGVVVEAASVGTRASSQQSGLGGPRVTYGSTESKVGDAAFRVQNQGSSNKLGLQGEPDLSAFQRPPSSSSGNKQIIRDPSHTLNYHNNIGLDNFNFAFETNNGIKIAQNGFNMDGALAQGGYSYIGDDGKEYSITYIADKDGYRAQGSHLPTPPPIPKEILLSLERNAKDEAAGIFDDGSYDPKKYNVDYDYNEAYNKYNDRHSHTFSNQPVRTSAYINQHQQGIVKPSSNGQFGLNSASKDSSFSKPDSSKVGSSLSQISNRFGSSGQTKLNVGIQSSIKEKESQSSLSSMNLANLHSAKPLSQQSLQSQKPTKPSFVRPSSYDVSADGLSTLSVSSRPSSLSSPSAFNQGVTNSFGNYNRGSSLDSSVRMPTQESLNSRIGSNPNLNKTEAILSINKYHENALNIPFTTSQPTNGYFASQSTQLPSANVPINQNSQLFGLQTTGFPTPSSIGQNLQNGPILSQFTSSFPTKKPQVTFTTPLETVQTTNAGVSSTQSENFNTQGSVNTKTPDILSTISKFVTQPGPSTTNGDYSTTYTGNFISSANTQGDRTSQIFGTQTTQAQENNRQTFQPQAPDHSYLYNRPSKPLEASIITTNSDILSTTSDLNRVTPSSEPQLSTSSLAPQSTLFFTNNQEIGVTQAEISAFPSMLPTSSDFKEQTQSVFSFSEASPLSTTTSDERTTFPDNQKLTTLFANKPEQIQNEPAPVKTQQNAGEIYQYSKPTETLSTNTNQRNDLTEQQGQRQQFNQNSEAQFGNKQSTRLPILSQATLDALNTVLSQTEYQSFSRPTEEPVRFDKLTTPSLSFQTQPASFNVQKPLTQPDDSSFFTSSLLSTQFENKQTTPTVGLEDFTNKDTTSFGTYFEKVPTSSQTQTNSLSTPTLSQSGQTTAFTSDRFSTNMPLQSTQFNIKMGEENNSKLTTYFQQQSTTSFNVPSTIPPSSFNTQTSIAHSEPGQIYDYTKPSQEFMTSSQREIQMKPELQFSHSSAQEARPSQILPNIQIGENTIPDSDHLSTNMPSHTQPMNSRFGQYSNSKQSTTQSGTGQPSTPLFTEPFSTPSSLISQTQTANLEFGEVYDYKKPAHGFVSTSQKESTFNTQFGQEALTSTQKMSTPFATVSTSGQFGENTVTNFDYTSTNIPQQTNQFSTRFGEYSNPKLVTASSATLFVDPSTIPQTTLNSQSQTTSAGSGEIYDYKKPTTVLISTSKNDNSGQTTPQQPITSSSGIPSIQFTQQTLPNNFHGLHFGVSSFTEKDKMTTNLDKTESVTPENPSTYFFPSTPEIQPTFNSGNSGEIYEYRKPEQGLLSPTEKEGTNQFGQNMRMTTSIENKERFETTPPTVSEISETTTTLRPFQETTQELPGSRQPFSFHRTCCSSSLFKDFDKQNKDGNLKDEGKEVNKNQNLESEVNHQAHFGEEFGGPRKPPSFDDSGYHY